MPCDCARTVRAHATCWCALRIVVSDGRRGGGAAARCLGADGQHCRLCPAGTTQEGKGTLRIQTRHRRAFAHANLMPQNASFNLRVWSSCMLGPRQPAGGETVIVIDQIPVVGEAKQSKLKSVIQKVRLRLNDSLRERALRARVTPSCLPHWPEAVLDWWQRRLLHVSQERNQILLRYTLPSIARSRATRRGSLSVVTLVLSHATTQRLSL